MATESKTFTREELFACLEKDGMTAKLDSTVIEVAKWGLGYGLGRIGYAYKDINDTDKAIAWCRLAAENDDIYGILLLAKAYKYGKGVPKDVLTALEYYLRLVVCDSFMVSEIPGLFLDKHKSGSVDKYKALEWYTRVKNTKNIRILNNEGFYLEEDDRNKPFIQLISEAEEYVEEQRAKKIARNAPPREKDVLNEQMIMTLQKDTETLLKKNQQLVDELREKNALQNSTNDVLQIQQNSIHRLEQQLKDREEMIKSLRAIVQSKENEIDNLKEINQLLREKQVLKNEVQEYQEHAQQEKFKIEDTSSRDDTIGNNSAISQSGTDQHHQYQCSNNRIDGIIVKEEPETDDKNLLLRTIGRKKRKVSSNDS